MTNSGNKKSAEQAQQLIEGVQAGDALQFEILYDNYAPLLFGAIVRLVPDEPLAARVLKDTLIRVRKDMLAGHCTKDNLCTWMLSIARNLSLEARDMPHIQGRKEETNSVLNLLLHKGYSLEQAAEKLNLSKEEVCKAVRAELNKNWG